MVSKKLQNIFLLSVVLWIAHGLEELITGLYKIDPHVLFVFGFAQKLDPTQTAFLTFQIMLWIMLIISYLLLRGPKWQLRLMVIPGLVMVYELHHLYRAAVVQEYYPGLYTALLFPVLALFFWKELIAQIRK